MTVLYYSSNAEGTRGGVCVCPFCVLTVQPVHNKQKLDKNKMYLTDLLMPAHSSNMKRCNFVYRTLMYVCFAFDKDSDKFCCTLYTKKDNQQSKRSAQRLNVDICKQRH